MTSAMRPVAINTAATCYEIRLRIQIGFSKLMYPCPLAKPSQVHYSAGFPPFSQNFVIFVVSSFFSNRWRSVGERAPKSQNLRQQPLCAGGFAARDSALLAMLATLTYLSCRYLVSCAMEWLFTLVCWQSGRFASNMNVDKTSRRRDLGEWKKQFTRIRQMADQGLGRYAMFLPLTCVDVAY